MPKGRLTTPLVRSGGTLQPASWDEALDAVAEGFNRARQTDTTQSFEPSPLGRGRSSSRRPPSVPAGM